jgi:hypothetical protein
MRKFFGGDIVAREQQEKKTRLGVRRKHSLNKKMFQVLQEDNVMNIDKNKDNQNSRLD